MTAYEYFDTMQFLCFEILMACNYLNKPGLNQWYCDNETIYNNEKEALSEEEAKRPASQTQLENLKRTRELLDELNYEISITPSPTPEEDKARSKLLTDQFFYCLFGNKKKYRPSLILDDVKEKTKKCLQLFFEYNYEHYTVFYKKDSESWHLYKKAEEICVTEKFDDVFNNKFISGKAITEIFDDIEQTIEFT